MTIEETLGSEYLEKEFGKLSFGQALWSHRKCAEISQKELALSLGISSQSLCDIEKGRKIPSPERAAKIAKQIGQPEKIWIELALQDSLRQGNLNYVVSVV